MYKLEITVRRHKDGKYELTTIADGDEHTIQSYDYGYIRKTIELNTEKFLE